MKHTPTPWVVQYGTSVAGPENVQVATTWMSGGIGQQSTQICIANAMQIVRCVNTNQQLVTALHDAFKILRAITDDHIPMAQLEKLDMARAVLRHALLRDATYKSEEA